jgi:leucine-rich repeat-containing G protein-coupled receptor 6
MLFSCRIISEARNVVDFPDLRGTSSLEVLRLDRAAINSVPSDFCVHAHNIRSL